LVPALASTGGNVATETSEGKTSSLLNGLGLDSRFARTSSSGTDSYLTDELGSTIALANEAGEPATEYSYDPFGASTSSGAASANPYQYTGGPSEGALQQDGARSYDPGLGRFISADPTGAAGSGVDLYQYAGSDPIDYADPSGLFSIGGFFEEVGEFATGFGDTVSGGLTRDVREGLGLAEPNYSSGAYGAGSDTGIAAAFAIPGDEEVGAEDATTTLYRAVGPDELSDIEKLGRYRVPEGMSEGKSFFETPEQASNFARKMGDQPYTTTSIEVSAAEMARAQQFSPVTEGPAQFFSSGDLPRGPVTISNSSVLP
jgi:RHS repeat-associated protein